MRRIPISFSAVTTRQAGTFEMDPMVMANLEKESRWQLGDAILNGMTRAVERKNQLGEWIYRFKGQLLDPKSVEAYLPSEWIDWRDA